MTSIAEPLLGRNPLYLEKTPPVNAPAGAGWIRVTDDPTTEKLEIYISNGSGGWTQAGSFELGTGAAPPTP